MIFLFDPDMSGNTYEKGCHVNGSSPIKIYKIYVKFK